MMKGVEMNGEQQIHQKPDNITA
jgi:hypothetical protein